MNKIDRCFAAGRPDLLSLYFTAGFPHLDSTPAVLRALLAHPDVDLIELGFPFSDPMADGPVIQRSSERALANGMSLAVLFAQLEALAGELRRSPKPVLLMGYFNPLLQYGVEACCARAAALGISGMIVPDLPVELYATQYRPIFERYGLAFVPLVTPATPEARLRRIDAQTDGFLYLVSGPGVTGSHAGVDADRAAGLAGIQSLGLRNPLLIGFGIHDRASFAAACRYAAGAVIGTAFIEALDRGESIEQSVDDFMQRFLATSIRR